MTITNTSSLPTVGAVGLGLIALIWAADGLSQPLWVDELHSSWVIADGWSDIPQRSRQGNQTPTYFALLKSLTWIFGAQSESLIRLPSLLAWSLSVASLAWMLLRQETQRLNSHGGQPNSVVGKAAVVLWCSCVLLDAWQYFYAIEARAYAIVQLLNIWAWFAVIRLSARGQEAKVWWWLAWSLLAGALLHLHITTGLAVIFQAVVLAAAVARSRRDRAYCLLSLLFIGLNAVWLLYDSQAIWQRRQQWATFAGDASVASLVSLFPLVPLLVPVGMGWLLARGLAWLSPPVAPSPPPIAGAQSQVQSPTQSTVWLDICVWGMAAVGPTLLAWLLTRYNIAPMFHYRFVIAAALPLYLFVGSWWLLQPNLTIRCLTVLIVFCWMNFSGGPLDPAQRGRWQNQRQEDWRSASEFVEQHFKEPSSQSLWCYAGLIEGVGLGLPITDSVDEYLSYPLRGGYRVWSAGTPVTPHGLVANRKLWLEQMRAQFRQARQSARQESKSPDDPAINSPVDPAIGTAAEVWIIYRGLAERLSSDLRLAGMHELIQIVPVRQFGSISLVCIKID